jgi:hypothetical protein
LKQETCWNMLDYNHWNIRVDDLWNIGETLGFSALTTKVRCKPKDGPHSLVVIFIFLRLFRHISRLLLISSWYDFLGYSDATTAGWIPSLATLHTCSSLAKLTHHPWEGYSPLLGKPYITILLLVYFMKHSIPITVGLISPIFVGSILPFFVQSFSYHHFRIHNYGLITVQLILN